MRTNLLLVEGLPGSGKSTTANLLYDLLKANACNVELFTEGNLDHPADYDGVSVFTKDEFEQLLLETENEKLRKAFVNQAWAKGKEIFLPYRKIQSEAGLPDDLLSVIFKKDIYELPFDRNVELIADRWAAFSEKALSEQKIYIFECCFIQNPLTIGMVKYGEPKEKVVQYVNRLTAAIERLNPVLFYVDQLDISYSFKKAVKERPAEWSAGFIDYYTNQGYGKMHQLHGLEGTLQVLEARREIEREIFASLPFGKVLLDNSTFDKEKHKSNLSDKLTAFGIL
ncbi:hypothetical protein D3P08_23765 [Paenibacillus nanensis]|uniref:Adenylyl-sulfate kinase n=1 Tax=Paenibacillus nanensis TaxID=393251 RepID=A0A3A1UR20_9BACL|nr:hypothetical protein [Paenibacillus nanensis]RIX48717.1 hypothetical protein D3P08_23765 [Paenibacillus nanensis]